MFSITPIYLRVCLIFFPSVEEPSRKVFKPVLKTPSEYCKMRGSLKGGPVGVWGKLGRVTNLWGGRALKEAICHHHPPSTMIDTRPTFYTNLTDIHHAFNFNARLQFTLVVPLKKPNERLN